MDIETIAIPNSIVEVGDGAVMGNRLVSLIIPDSVKIIGIAAFMDNFLEQLYIPKGVEAIGSISFNWNSLPQESAFIYSSGTDTATLVSYGGALLDNVVVPNNVQIIGMSTFAMTDVKSITLPDNLTEIGSYAFSNSKLAHITIPEGVHTIGEGAFIDSSLGAVIFKGNLPLSLSPYIFSYNWSLWENTIWVKNTELEKYRENASTFDVDPNAFYTGEMPDFSFDDT